MSSNNSGSNTVQSADLRIADLIAILWNEKWLIIGAGLFGFVVAAGVSLVMDPVFRASVIVAEAEQPEAGALNSLVSQFGGLAGLAGFGIGHSPSVDQSLAVLQSVQFTQEFIQKENAFAELFKDEWDVRSNSLKKASGWRAWLTSLREKIGGTEISTGPSAGTTKDLRVLWEGYRRFARRMHIDRDRRTQLVTISIDSSSPELAARWVKRLVESLNSELRARAIAESEARIEFLDNRLKETTTLEMREALFRLIEAEQKRALVAHTRAEYALRVLSPAVIPDKRVSPHRTLIALAGGLIGGLVASLWVFAIGISRRSVDP